RSLWRCRHASARVSWARSSAASASPVSRAQRPTTLARWAGRVASGRLVTPPRGGIGALPWPGGAPVRDRAASRSLNRPFVRMEDALFRVAGPCDNPGDVVRFVLIVPPRSPFARRGVLTAQHQ